MLRRLKVPFYAKLEASRGLRERLRTKAGLTKEEAKVLGIQSGVERAKQIIRNKYIYEDDLKSMARFYLRFRNRRTARSENAIQLWGGRNWLNLIVKIFYSKN
jgi:hypothetical protein